MAQSHLGDEGVSIAVQLEDGHEGLGGNLYGSQIPHLLACSPQKQAFVGSPDQIQMAGNEFRPFQGFACGKTLGRRTCGGKAKESIAVQLEDGHEGLGGNLYGSQIPHLLACSPQKQAFVGSPDQIQMAGNEFRPFQGFACGKTLGRRTCGGKATRINRCPA